MAASLKNGILAWLSASLLLSFSPAPVFGEGSPRAIRVDMYPRSARVIFSVPVGGKASFQLPAAFDEASVRPLPSEGLTVHSFEAVEIPRSGWVPPELEPLRQRIREKERAEAVLLGKISAIQQSFALLQGPFPAELKGNDVPDYVEAARIAREKLEMENISFSESLGEIKRDLEALKQDYEDRMPEKSGRAVHVEASLSGRGALLVEAWTGSAGWIPFYRMDLESATGKISGAFLARARQKTGLPLEGEVHFHTATPSSAVIPPEIAPLVADFERNLPPARPLAMERGAAKSLLRAESLPAESAPVVEQTMTDMSASATGILAGDGSYGEMTLGSFSLKGETSIVSVPSLSEQAWITAECKAIPFPILPGTVELSVDGRISGKTSVKEHGAGTDLTVAFGKMPLVRAIRRQSISREGTSWTGKGRIEDGYSIEITNGTPSKLSVVIRDRIPVSAQEKISVETMRIEPKAAEQSERNILTWKLDLAPGETKSAEVIYSLRFPSDERVIFR